MQILDPKTSYVNKKLQNFINKIAYIGDSNIPDDDGKIYYSKTDGSYLTRVGMEEELDFLLKRGITESIQDGYDEPKTSNIGFNPSEKKWYGWSHRAIFGFGVGSECKQGDCGFKPSNKNEFRDRAMSFWGDDLYSEEDTLRAIENEDGVIITYIYNQEVPNESLRGTKYEHFSKYPEKWGKGEWKAKTLEDAKQMAIDFAKSIS